MSDENTLPMKPAHMSPEQYTYAVAKAAAEAAHNLAAVEIRKLYDALDVNQMQEEFEAKTLPDAADKHLTIYRHYHIDALDQALRQAEDVLIQWAHGIIAAHPKTKENPEALRPFTDPKARRAPHREKLVALCFKLPPILVIRGGGR